MEVVEDEAKISLDDMVQKVIGDCDIVLQEEEQSSGEKQRRTSRRSAANKPETPKTPVVEEPAEEDEEEGEEEAPPATDTTPIRKKRGRKPRGTDKANTERKAPAAGEKRVLRDRRSLAEPEHFIASPASGRSRRSTAETTMSDSTSTTTNEESTKGVRGRKSTTGSPATRRGQTETQDTSSTSPPSTIRPGRRPTTTTPQSSMRRGGGVGARTALRPRGGGAGGRRPLGGVSTAAAIATPSRAAGGGRGRKTAAAMADDPFSLESMDVHPELLKDISVRRSGQDFVFTRALDPVAPITGGSRYATLEKAASARRYGGASAATMANDVSPIDSDTVPVYHVTTMETTLIEKVDPTTGHITKAVQYHSATQQHDAASGGLTPGMRRQISPSKSTPSSGYLADTSSFGKKTTSGESEAPRSTPGSLATAGSADLFSDVVDRDDDYGEHEDERRNEEDNRMDVDYVQETTKTPLKRGRGRPSKASLASSAASTGSGRGRGRGRKRWTYVGPPSGDDDDDEDDLLDEQTPRKRRRHGGAEEGVMPLRVEEQEPDVPNLSAAEQLSVDHPILPPTADTTPIAQGSLLAGARVMAKWKDRYFYPGRVVSRDGLGRYKVRYVTGGVRDMPQPDAVPLALLQPGKTLMYCADQDEGLLEPVEILQPPNAENSQEWYDGVFLVRNVVNEEEQRVSWEKFIIDKEQTKAFVQHLKNEAYQQISMDNVSGSRVRERRSSTKLLVAQQHHQHSPTPTTTTTTPRGRKPKQQPPTKNTTPLFTQHRQTTAPQAATTTARAVSSPDLFFSGKIFVLTSANRRAKPTGVESGSDEERPPIPFVKREVRNLIEQHGGKVVDDFSAVPSDSEDTVFLVADTHYRTHKYLSALCRGVPCVSHLWVHNCCRSDTNQLLDYQNYMLPAGQSIETSNMIEWHSCGPSLLSGVRVMVQTENRPTHSGALDFVQIWKPLVGSMGATLIDTLPSPTEDGDTDEQRGAGVDIVLTDASCVASTLERVSALGAAAVSSEWLIQAIITGRPPSPDAHPRYRYDFVENATANSTIASQPQTTAASESV